MAINKAWSAIWSDVSVNSAHGFGDVYDGRNCGTLYQNRYFRRLCWLEVVCAIRC
ncbi:MAG: hypothetical protein V7K27_05635 [Nostoc sp.]|uniref:hypothetical protein n=1 Tax=Nostoc sp. TaxID=1180 RepID=UPI002FF9D60F